MSRLRQSFLENIRILGNQSGCHQLPERSLFYKGKQFPVCARCTGVTIGHLTAILLNLFRFQVSLVKSIFLLSVMGFDWGIQYFQVKESTNVRRLITGFMGGFGLFNIYFIFLRKTIKQLTKKSWQ